MGALRVFGCQAFVHVPEERCGKLDAKSQKRIFVGYDDKIQGYRCYDPKAKKMVTSRDVIFNESQSYYDAASDMHDEEGRKLPIVDHLQQQDDEIMEESTPKTRVEEEGK